MGFIQTGNLWFPQTSIEVISKLPKGTYYVRFDNKKGYFLERVQDFTLPNKIYGDTSIVSRWIKSYQNTARNTGVLLSGIKGSGKTLLSKKLALDCNLPVIIIDTPYDDSDFISLMTNPELGDCCILIDEFEKVYAEDGDADTSVILSLLDGTFNTHNLFIFTCNKMKVSNYLINRPSRIRYRTHFESLDNQIVDEVIEDILINKEYANSIKLVLNSIGEITFDILISLINEVNLFNEPGDVCAKYLNLEKSLIKVDVYEIWKGKEVPIVYSWSLAFSGPYCLWRVFEQCDDPEYCDKNLVPKGAPYKGLDDKILILREKIKKINSDLWEYKTEKEHLIFKRFKYSGFEV